MNKPLSPLIHLIDDDEAVRQSLALLIGTVGLRVQTWADPQAFLSEFDRDGVGAIVLDVRMPGISGLSVLDTLIAQSVDQPVIMLTGHGSVEMCRRAFKLTLPLFTALHRLPIMRTSCLAAGPRSSVARTSSG